MRISDDLTVVPHTFGEYIWWYELLGGKENNLAVEKLRAFGEPDDKEVKLSDEGVRRQLNPLLLKTLEAKKDEIGDTEWPA